MVDAARITFTKHAIEKFDVLRDYGFEIQRKQIIETILDPESLHERGNQFFATRAMDLKHAVRVVYEKRKGYFVIINSILLGGNAMAYKIKCRGDADVLSVILKEKGKLSHAEEVGDIVVHFGKDGKPLFMEILKASKVVPLMVEGLAKKEVTVA